MMRRIIVMTLSLAAFAVIFLLGRGAPVAAAWPTPVCGSLPTSPGTRAGSPYVVCAAGVSVPATATLTIQPGVTVEFTPTAVAFHVFGTLSAAGSLTQPITFTSVISPVAGS